MSLAKKIVAVSQNLVCHESQYAKARARHAALAPFESGTQVVGALDASSPLSAADRYAIIAALVAEQQDSACPLWGAMLVLAFAPMLLRVRRRLGRSGDEDRDSQVLIAFLEAIGDVQPDAYASIALQRATWKALLAQRKAEECDVELVSFDETLHTPTSPDGITVAELRAEAAWTLRREQRAEAARRRTPADVRPLATKAPRRACETAA